MLDQVGSRQDRLIAHACKTFKTASRKPTTAVVPQDESSRAFNVANSSVTAAEEELRLLKSESELTDNEFRTRLVGHKAIGRLLIFTGSYAGVTVGQASFSLV
jgi:hypothetical protein